MRYLRVTDWSQPSEVLSSTNMYQFYSALKARFQGRGLRASVTPGDVRRYRMGELRFSEGDGKRIWALETLLSLLEVRQNIEFLAAAGAQYEQDLSDGVYRVRPDTGFVDLVHGAFSVFHASYRLPMGTAIRGDIQKGDILRTSPRFVISERHSHYFPVNQAISFHPSVSFPTEEGLSFDENRSAKATLMQDFFDGLDDLFGRVLALPDSQKGIVLDYYVKHIVINSIGCANDRIRAAIEKSTALMSCLSSRIVTASVLSEFAQPLIVALQESSGVAEAMRPVEMLFMDFQYELNADDELPVLRQAVESRRDFWREMIGLGVTWGLLEQEDVERYLNQCVPVASPAVACAAAGTFSRQKRGPDDRGRDDECSDDEAAFKKRP